MASKKIKTKQRTGFFAILFIILCVIAAISHLEKAENKKGAIAARSIGVTAKPSRAVDPGMVLKYLIETHPRKEIREDLNGWINRGYLSLNFQDDLGNDNALAGFILVDIDGRRKQVFHFKASGLLDKNVADSFKYMVIWHEYQHILQWLSGEASDRMFLLVDKGAQLTPKEAKMWFENESAAYLAECDLAKEHGWSNEFALCRIYEADGVISMRKALAESLISAFPKDAPHRVLLMKLAENPPKLNALKK